MYKNNKFVLISSEELALPSYIKDILKARGCEYTEVSTIEEAIGSLDVLYMTRIQKERFASEEEYQNAKNQWNSKRIETPDEKSRRECEELLIEIQEEKKSVTEERRKV